MKIKLWISIILLNPIIGAWIRKIGAPKVDLHRDYLHPGAGLSIRLVRDL